MLSLSQKTCAVKSMFMVSHSLTGMWRPTRRRSAKPHNSGGSGRARAPLHRTALWVVCVYGANVLTVRLSVFLFLCWFVKSLWEGINPFARNPPLRRTRWRSRSNDVQQASRRFSCDVINRSWKRFWKWTLVHMNNCYISWNKRITSWSGFRSWSYSMSAPAHYILVLSGLVPNKVMVMLRHHAPPLH